MTKEEYLKTKWLYENCDSRAIDEGGQEFYFPSHPSLNEDGEWRQYSEEGIKYDYDEVDSLWYRSFQTKQHYLQLQNKTND